MNLKKIIKYFEKKYQINFKSAFSLIEISVVILIVAVSLIGVMQGQEMYYKMRLNTARVLTERSQVRNVENLVWWLETTLQESLYLTSTSTSAPALLNDNQTIGRWNDLNFDKNFQNNVFQNTDANRPIYKINAMNGLPALQFDGVNDFMQNANLFYYNNFTVFVVALPLKSCTSAGVPHFGTSGQNYVIYPSQGDVVNAGNSSAGFGISLCKNQIAIIEHSSSYMPARNFLTQEIKNPVLIDVVYNNKVPTLYVNSRVIGSQSASAYNVFPSFRIGGGSSVGENYGFFSGLIGEVIYYSSTLKDEDRKAVEGYLMDKWQIK